MDFTDLVKQRASVRHYLNKPVSRDDLLMCVEAARLAPSACNAQPWRFIIVDDKDTIAKVTEGACHGPYSFNKFIINSAALIIAVSDKEGFLRKAAGRIKRTDYYLIDIGIACEHMVLQAQELGIGSCWIGWFDERRLKKIFGLQAKIRVDVILALGYCGLPGLKPKPRKSVDEVVSFFRI